MRFLLKPWLPGLLVLVALLFYSVSFVHAGEELYRELVDVSRGKGDPSLFADLNREGRKIDWSRASHLQFEGNLRRLVIGDGQGGPDQTDLYLIHHPEGQLYILSIPGADAVEEKEAEGLHDKLDDLLGDKLVLNIQVVEGSVSGKTYFFARFLARPEQVIFDRIFKLCITLMLFSIMVGMGLTLTLQNFRLVFKKPKVILIGSFLQWVMMPLMGVGIGHLLGFYERYPFIYVGVILVCVIPGGVISNLMTYYARGDVALSVSLTSFSTVLSLLFTPLLLTLYCANVPEVTLPVALIIQTIIVLVIIPLALGMLVRARWPAFAQKATPVFSTLGVVALILIIITALITNFDKFADTERYGVTTYLAVLGLSFGGMVLGMIIPKLLRVNNYQIRALSMETGLRNTNLAMTIALLLQDIMGDFHSSMFAVSAIFGLGMFLAGFAAIRIFKIWLPIDDFHDAGPHDIAP